MPDFPEPQFKFALKILFNFASADAARLTSQTRADNELQINKWIKWDAAPLSLPYYFGSMVGPVPEDVVGRLPEETQSLLREM